MIVGIGCDITKIKRFQNKDLNFINKILSNDEIELYNHKVGDTKAEFLAGRFCAKEAIIKALSASENITMPDINITYKNGKPSWSYKNFNVLISISHEKDYAISYVCIQKDWINSLFSW